MEAHQAKYEGALDRLRTDITQYETRLLLSIVVMITLGVSVMGIKVALIALLPASQQRPLKNTSI
ncbi:MAG: hypothetical protein OXE94_03710 [Aestuariivita sp.]|nr:hypothetical protein [Aestuariivita sp.]MCY4201822.1 hypothetical protein [Aestuariivita sp.]